MSVKSNNNFMNYLFHLKKQTYNFIPIILSLLVLLRGGREVLGIVVFYLISLLFFYIFLRKEKPFIYSTNIDLPIIALLSIITISQLHSIVSGTRDLTHYISFLIFIMLFYLMVRTRKEQALRDFLILYIIICGILSLVVCIEGFVKWRTYTGAPPHANFPNHNLLAGFIAPGIITAVCFIASKDMKNLRITALVWISLILMILSQFFTFSRGAWISIFAGILFLVFINFKKILMPIILVIMICLFGFIVMPKQYAVKWVAHKFFSEKGTARTTIWQTGFNAFKSNPIIGWGLGSFSQVYDKFKVPCQWETAQYGRTTRFAHNEYLDCAVENGIFGLLAFFLVIVFAIKEGIKAIRYSQENIWLITACVGGTIVILTHSIFDFNLHLPAITFLLVYFTSNYVSEKNKIEFQPLTINFFKIAVLFLAVIIIIISSSFLFAEIGKKNKLTALKYYKIAVILNPFNTDFWISRITLEPNTSQKENLFKQALLFNPNNSTLYCGLAKYYFSANKNKEALNSYSRVIELEPYNAIYYSEMADVCYKNKDYKNSYLLYSKAAQLEPFYIYAHARLAEISFLFNNKDISKKEIAIIDKVRKSSLFAESEYAKRLLDYSYKNMIDDLRKMTQ